MFIYHFNRLIRNKILWGSFAIVISIAFVAVDSCFRDPEATQTAGILNGKKITLRSFDEVARSIRGFGRNRDNTSSASVIDRRAWEQIAARQNAAKNGMASSKAEIINALRGLQAFQGPNGFDINRYTAALREQGLTPESYERLIAHQLTLMKSAALVSSASWVSQMELDDELSAMTDEFTVQVATFSNAFEKADMKLTDKDFRTYYTEHTNTYALPDRIAVRYITIPVTNYLPFVNVPEDDVRDYYDAHSESYTRTTTNKTTEPIPYEEVRVKILDELKLDEAAYCASTAITFQVYSKMENTNENSLITLSKAMKLAVKESPLFGAEENLYFVPDGKEFAAAAFELDPESPDARYGIVKGKKSVYVVEEIKRDAAHIPTYEKVLGEVKPQALAKARSDAFEKASKEMKKALEKSVASGKSFADAAKAQSLNVSTQIVYSVNSIQKTPFENSFSVAYGAMKVGKGKISDAIPASASRSLFVFVKDRKQGEELSAEMMRAQIRSGIARRNTGDLFSDWLAWNLKRQSFQPTHPISEENDAEAGVGASDEEE